jgi:hypothetical protein
MFKGDTMTSLLEIELENVKARYQKALECRRNDLIADIVLNRMLQEIQTLERKVNHEERSRVQVASHTNTNGSTHNAKQTVCGYWTKYNGNHHAICGIPAIETL